MLSVVLSLTMFTRITSYAGSGFSDTKGHWAESYINDAVKDGFAGGYPDGRFRPDKAVTRAEFAAMINKALGNTNTINLNFNDVSTKDWYYTDISKAVAASYVSGYSDNTFRPDSPITRQEAAASLARIIPSGSRGNISGFPDSGSVASWASDSLAKVIGKKYMGAYNDGRIHPADQLTRAQTAKIISDILDKETIVTGNTSVKSDGTKLADKIYSNNVTIQKDLGEDSASIEDCVILGTLTVQGGGENTITITDTRIANAVVDKDDKPVRILAKGETSIVALSASEDSVLQTSGLSGALGTGFGDVNVKASAKVTLKGDFPKVSIVGSKADVTLYSGSIDNLTVETAGRYSDIRSNSGTSISNAVVNAESYFHGSGTISHMDVNASNITYETKPRNWTIGSSVKTPSSADPEQDITFSPKKGASNVKLDTKITVTFSEAMEMANGDKITSSNIKDFIELRKSSESGSKLTFSASIDSAKKVITITPDSNLSKDTKYYLILTKNSIRNGRGDKNSEQVTYFSTGDNADSLSATYSPANGASNVSTSTGITITLSEEVVRYSNGATISSSDSYLKDCIVFRKNSASGDTVSYSASINSSKKVITITPNSALVLNQKYYVGILANKLKAKSDGDAVPASSVTWTTGVVTPSIDNLSLASDASSITATVKSNIAGTAYLVALPATYGAINAAQVISGQNSSNTYVDAKFRASGSIAAGTAKAFTFSNLSGNTSYTVYAVINGNGTNSPVKSASASTTKQTVKLSSLEVIPSVNGVSNPGNQISFSESTSTYNISLNTGISSLRINASGQGNISINGEPAAANSLSKEITLGGGSQTITVSITKDGTEGSTYKINVDRTNNSNYSSLSVKADGREVSGSGDKFALTTLDAAAITISVTAEDKFATVVLDQETIRSGTASFTLPAGKTDQTYSFSIKSGSNTGTYTITFTRPQETPNPEPQPNPEPEPTPQTPSTDTGGAITVSAITRNDNIK